MLDEMEFSFRQERISAMAREALIRILENRLKSLDLTMASLEKEYNQDPNSPEMIRDISLFSGFRVLYTAIYRQLLDMAREGKPRKEVQQKLRELTSNIPLSAKQLSRANELEAKYAQHIFEESAQGVLDVACVVLLGTDLKDNQGGRR